MRRMKATGPIPAGYGMADGELAIGGVSASALVEKAGDTPLFVYSSAHLRQRVKELRAAMPRRLALHYAMKANPFPPLLAIMHALVDGFDVASGGELEMALDAGANPDKISFAGPGKRDRDLERAITLVEWPDRLGVHLPPHALRLRLEPFGEGRRATLSGGREGLLEALADG